MAMQPAPERKSAEQQAAEEQQAARERAAEERAARERAARERAAEEQAAEEQAAEEQADQQARSLSMARRLLASSNAATTLLEIDSAHDQLSAFDLPFFQEQAQLERERFLTEVLAAAGRGLLDSFTNLINADDLWDRLARSGHSLRQQQAESPHPYLFRMELAELLSQHIPEVLRGLGYQPPPPSEEWTRLVQHSVQRLLTASQDGETSATNSAKARQELIFFTWRLRTLVEAGEQALNEDKRDESRSSEILHSLRTVVTSARNRAIPAALAAGASAAVAGAAGGPAGIGIAFLSGGAASLLASATEAAATAWLADPGHGDAPMMQAALLLTTELGALDGCIDLMRSATRANVESIRFIIRRGVFQILQDAAGYTVPVRNFLWDWGKALLSELGKDTFRVDEAHELVDVARKAIATGSQERAFPSPG